MRDELRKIVNNGWFDLHIHTTASDGSYSPKEVVQRAKQNGLMCIAITDHDTLDGIAEAIEEGGKLGVVIIPGIELSTKYRGKSIDILGYGMTNHSELKSLLIQYCDGRLRRAQLIIDKFTELGMPLTMEDVMQFSRGSIIARPHIAKAVVQKGYVADTQTVFDQFLGNGRPCDVEKVHQSTQEAISLIHRYGGCAVLAHPILIQDNDLVNEIVDAYPFDGIEVWHSKQKGSSVQLYKEIAERFGLLMTGGSDFHNDQQSIGDFGLSWHDK